LVYGHPRQLTGIRLMNCLQHLTLEIRIALFTV
jgi:hypothetical protein